MKRALIISNYFYPYIGGIEMTSKVMAKLFTKNGIESKVICFNEDAQEGDRICHREETVHDVVDGVEVIRCGCFAKILSQSLSWTYPGELKQIMDQYRPEIIIFHYPNPYLSHFLLKYSKRDYKLIVYYNSDIIKQKVLGRLFHRQTMKLLERANAIAALSPNYIEGSPFLSKFQAKCSVVSCCVQAERLKLSKYAKELSMKIREEYAGKTICFTCCRHVSYKGLIHIIKASEYLDERFQIMIGGEGPLTESLMKEAAGDNKIVFLHRLNDEELMAYFSACDIYCFPSITKNESFGIALAEAMYFGKPSVTFSIPGSGVNYVSVNGLTGIECPNGDSRAFASAIMQLATDASLYHRMSENARKRVEECFTEKQFEEHFFQLLDS